MSVLSRLRFENWKYNNKNIYMFAFLKIGNKEGNTALPAGDVTAQFGNVRRSAVCFQDIYLGQFYLARYSWPPCSERLVTQRTAQRCELLNCQRETRYGPL